MGFHFDISDVFRCDKEPRASSRHDHSVGEQMGGLFQQVWIWVPAIQ